MVSTLWVIFLFSCEKEDPTQLPEIFTLEVHEISDQSAATGGSIIDDGGGLISAKGVCWSVNPGPTINNNKTTDGIENGDFISFLTGLSPMTEYYVRAYATNSAGTSYGNERSFTTTTTLVEDIDGNNYKTVRIGSQTWMAENLRSTKCNNGEVIPLIIDYKQWWSLETPAYCWYNNDKQKYGDPYGALYNFYAVTGDCNICPAGWHVPSLEEWDELIQYLGGDGIAGGKMKTTGLSLWLAPNSGASNSSGFSAVPAGRRYWELFINLGAEASFWSTTINSDEFSYVKTLFYHEQTVNPMGKLAKQAGLSVRCIKD